jgi:hypothetical protein
MSCLPYLLIQKVASDIQAIKRRMNDIIRTKKLGIAGLFVVLLTKKKIPIVSKNIIVEGIKPDSR